MPKPDAPADTLLASLLAELERALPPRNELTLHSQVTRLAAIMADTRAELTASLEDAASEHQLAMHMLGQLGVPWDEDGKMLTLVERIQLLAKYGRGNRDAAELVDSQRYTIQQLTSSVDRTIDTLAVACGQPRTAGLGAIVGHACTAIAQGRASRTELARIRQVIAGLVDFPDGDASTGGAED